MSPLGSYTSSPQALPTASSANGLELSTGYDDQGFSTVRTIYHGTTPSPTATGLQNNAASAIPAAPEHSSAWKFAVSSILPWAIIILHLPSCLGF